MAYCSFINAMNFFSEFVNLDISFDKIKLQYMLHILHKKESLHILDEKLPNLTKTHFFEKYVHMKAARLTRQTYAKVSKLIRR